MITGEASLDELADAFDGCPLVAHDAKSLGGGRHGLLAAASRRGPRSSSTTTRCWAPICSSLSGEATSCSSWPPTPGIGVRGAERGKKEDAGEGEQLELGEDAEQGLDPAEEARIVVELARWQRGRLEEWGLEQLLREVELPLVHVLAAMEREGLKLDVERLAEIGSGIDEQIEQLESEIHELAGHPFTIGSPQQVGKVLFEELGLTRKRRGKTGFSTDARVLAQIREEHPIVEKIETWRELTKLKSTYLDTLPDLVDPDSGRVHTTFNQAATTTGRLSSTNPNLQNIPIRTEIGRPVRACFVAERGARLLSADYSQVELRVLAHVAEEEVLKAIFRAGDDVHAATAAEVFNIPRDDVDIGQRSKAKMVNFGIVYGLTGFGLADRLNIPRGEGEEFVARYLERFPAVAAFRKETIERAQTDGYVTTLMGRRRLIPELRSPNPNTRRLGERLAVNTVIQGTAADIIKVAMVRCHLALRESGAKTRLVLQIHDELLFEGPPGEMEAATETVSREMCAAQRARPAARGRGRGGQGLAGGQIGEAPAGGASPGVARWGVGFQPVEAGALDQFDLVEHCAVAAHPDLCLVDDRALDQVVGAAGVLVAVIAVVPVLALVAGVVLARVIVAGVVLAALVVCAEAVVAVAVAARRLLARVIALGLALDLGAVGDHSGDRPARRPG